MAAWSVGKVMKPDRIVWGIELGAGVGAVALIGGGLKAGVVTSGCALVVLKMASQGFGSGSGQAAFMAGGGGFLEKVVCGWRFLLGVGLPVFFAIQTAMR